MSVEWSKPIQTNDGRKARVLCADLVGQGLQVAVAVTSRDGLYESVFTCSIGGISAWIDGNGPIIIINVPPRKETREVEAWAVVTSFGRITSTFFTESAARLWSSGFTSPHRIVRLTGTVEIEVQE